MNIDKRTAIGIAYLQLHDDTLRIPFGLFHKCVEIALNRPVYTHEFGSNKVLPFGTNNEGLRKEIKKAFKKELEMQDKIDWRANHKEE